ncbi:MAG: site-2 protease family protein [Selenomonadaceae bacterium]|nr:site-2 protease family protein [Selenomonadaceae bacterium]
MFDFDLMGMIAGLPGLLIALVFHEYAHARMAVAMGDFTPRLMGRLTLDPRAHIDPIGLVMLLVARFGWAKPVEYNPMNFRERTKGEILTALAGPAANFITAFVALLVLVLLRRFVPSVVTGGVYTVLWMIVIYNINFGIFNLIPLPPLDGSKVLYHIIPYEHRWRYMQLERYSFLILIAMMMTPILGSILVPLARLTLKLFSIIISLLLGGIL